MKKLLGIALLLLCISVSAQEPKTVIKNDVEKGDKYLKAGNYESARSYYEIARTNPALRDSADVRLRFISEVDKRKRIAEIDKEIKELKAKLEIEKTKLAKKYGKENAEKIIKGNLWIGMSEEIVLEMLGDPAGEKVSSTESGIIKELLFERSKYPVVELKNGKVVKWEKVGY